MQCTQSTFEALVLDEADRLLDLGFKQDISTIISRLPKQRRTGLFSASMSEAVESIIRVGLRNPVKVAVKVKNLRTGGVVEERTVPASLQMTYLVTPASRKLPALSRLLGTLDPRPQKTIVFLSTCAAVDYFSAVLPGLLPDGFALVPLHGKHDGKVRERNFARFMNSVQPTVLLTTDVAARGLDFPQVDLVAQIDPPTDPKNFKHRAGRAGRAGRRGLAVVFLHPGREEDYVAFMEIRGTPIAPLAPALTQPEEEGRTEAEEAEEATRRIREAVRRDRALHDRGQRAFVSWVRSYGKHAAASIFSVRDLDWADLGRAWGLLRLPRMPETKALPDLDRSLGVCDLDWDAYAYAQRDREKLRLAALRREREQAEAEANAEGGAEDNDDNDRRAKRKRNAEAWSGRHEQEETRAARREKRRRRQETKRREEMTEDERAREAELQDMLRQIRSANREKLRAGKPEESGGVSGGGGGATKSAGKKASLGKAKAAAASAVDDDEFEGFD